MATRKHLFIRLTIILAILLPVNLHARTSKTDSLKLMLSKHKTEDTARVNLLNQIGFELYRSDKPECEKKVNEALKLSTKLGYLKGKANSLWILGLCISDKDQKQALEKYKEALKISEIIDDKNGQCLYLNTLGVIYKKTGNLDLSDSAYTQSLRLARELNNKKAIQKSLVNMSINLIAKGDLVSASRQLYETINIAEEMKDSLLLAKSYGNLAYVNRMLGGLPQAHRYYRMALSINEKMKDETGKWVNLLNLSGIQNDLNETENALKTINEAHLIATNNKDSVQIGICYANIGNILKNSDKQKALNYLTKSLGMPQREPRQKISTLNSIGEIYMQLNQSEKAFAALKKAQALADKNKLPGITAEVSESLGRYYLSVYDFPKAIESTQNALVIAKRIKYNKVAIEAYKTLSEIYARKGDYQNAYLSQAQHKALNDSVYNEKNYAKIALLENEYSFAKEREYYEFEQTKGKLQISKQKQLIGLLAIICLLLIALFSFLIHFSRLKKNMLALELKNSNDELEQNRKEMVLAQLKLIRDTERDAYTIKILEEIKDTVEGNEAKKIGSLVGNYKHEALQYNWKELETIFSKVNPEFHDEINKRFPDLTPNERKLCVFLKLNLSNKDIALITFQNEEALKKARLRLRKKLGIERSENLTSFIQGI